MIEAIISAVMAFIGTNIDDIFLLTIFFANAKTKHESHSVWLGQYLGVFALYLISVFGAVGLSFLPEKYISFLGILPILLGVKAIFEREEEQADSSISSKAFAVMLVTIANGADNLGVYIPLFSSFAWWQTAVAGGIFVLMIAIFCFLGKKLASLSFLRSFLFRRKRIVVPLILIALGIYILLSGLLG